MEKDFETEVLTRLAVIESKLDGYKEIKKATYENESRSKKNEEDIKELQDKFKWLSRTTARSNNNGSCGDSFYIYKNRIEVKLIWK